MNRAYYSDSIDGFRVTRDIEILGVLTQNSDFAVEQAQRDAWLEQIGVLRSALPSLPGAIYFEYSIPRMGRRIDVVLLIGPVVFVLEFKIGEREFAAHAIDQVWDYALDLKNFHEPSHTRLVAPILIATRAVAAGPLGEPVRHADGVLSPITTNAPSLAAALAAVLENASGEAVEPASWEAGRYCPTPTIIEAALALYSGHSVNEISRSDAGATNLTETSNSISSIIEQSRQKHEKAICFVTGVPGAGKTLVGLNMGARHIGVFLSGNGPLVEILREALARDRVGRERARGKTLKKGDAAREVKTLIQNVHHFRDECLRDIARAPVEHVAVFDEAQRAWNVEQTSNFMRRKKGMPGFSQSEPEYQISCMNRHPDWSAVVCLVGGGQEINTGEAGISEWVEALTRSFPDWHIYISPRLTDSEYGAGQVLRALEGRPNVVYKDELHLGVSMRSFRAENVSLLVKQILDLEADDASKTLRDVSAKYPMVVTRDLTKAKQWLRDQARGSERYGMVVSSEAQRLKPYAIDVKTPVDPVHWFLDGKEDVRSSYYLEDVATEFQVQGLELDWACVTWDADLRYTHQGWQHWSFCGDRWNRINKPERRNYLKNAYRVLLTRARQGMVIVVPPGDANDRTRSPSFYDTTFNYLKALGFATI